MADSVVSLVKSPHVVEGELLNKLVSLIEAAGSDWDEQVVRGLAEEAQFLWDDRPPIRLEKVREQSASMLRQYREMSDRANIEGVWGAGAR